MIVVLPPSETKRDGGDGPPVDVEALSFTELNPVRIALVDELEMVGEALGRLSDVLGHGNLRARGDFDGRVDR